jgi:CD109 antigen
LSRYYEMKVFEYHEPGNANKSMYYLRDIFGLDICEVCGSYQCPYCPYYAFSLKLSQSKLFIIIFFVLAYFFNIEYNYMGSLL